MSLALLLGGLSVSEADSDTVSMSYKLCQRGQRTYANATDLQAMLSERACSIWCTCQIQVRCAGTGESGGRQQLDRAFIWSTVNNLSFSVESRVLTSRSVVERYGRGSARRACQGNEVVLARRLIVAQLLPSTL